MMKIKIIVAILFFFVFTSKKAYSFNSERNEFGCYFYFNESLNKNVYIMSEQPVRPPADIMLQLNNGIRFSSEMPVGSHRITLHIIVNEEGKVVFIRVFNKSKEDYTALEKEVIRVLRKIKWYPAKCNDNKVTAQIVLPINISLNAQTDYMADIQDNRQAAKAMLVAGNKLDFALLDRYSGRIRSGIDSFSYRWQFTDENGAEIRFSGGRNRAGGSTVEIPPPPPAFYTIIRWFHPNGYLRSEGKEIARVRIGVWKHYDETGELIRTVDEDAKFGKFDYNEVLLFLHKQRYINLETGENRDRLTFGFCPENMLWAVIFTAHNLIETDYTIDGKTGEVIDKVVRVLH